MVGATALRVPGVIHIHCLLDLGGPAGSTFPLRPVSFALLFAGVVRPSSSKLVRAEPELDSCLGNRRNAHSVGTGRLSRHLLLLSWGVLQSFLGRSAFLHRGRAKKKVPRGTILPPNHSEHPPIFSLSRPALSDYFGPRRMGCVLV